MSVKHIGIFGRRNVGKSSLINLLLGQDFAIVSDQAGTTTDPVKKRMEIPDVGWRIPMDREAWRVIVHGIAKSQT